MKAMILTAGLGTRLRPLTLERAKPAIPFLGKPLVAGIIERLQGCGARQFRLNLHHLPRTIESIFQSSPWNALDVSFSYEPQILGTAGGLKNNESFFDDQTFLMANGDIVFDFPLDRAIQFHRDRRAIATLILYRQTPPYIHYPVRIDGEGRLSDFKDTGSGGDPTDEVYVFTGIHILEPRILDLIPRGEFCEIAGTVYPELLLSGQDIYGFPVEGYWNDLGSPLRYLQAQADMMERSGAGARNPSAGATIHKDCRIGPNVSMEEGCVVAEAAELENSILWEGVTVAAGVSIKGCVIGSGVNVACDCEDRVISRLGEVPIVRT